MKENVFARTFCFTKPFAIINSHVLIKLSTEPKSINLKWWQDRTKSGWYKVWNRAFISSAEWCWKNSSQKITRCVWKQTEIHRNVQMDWIFEWNSRHKMESLPQNSHFNKVKWYQSEFVHFDCFVNDVIKLFKLLQQHNP